MAEPVLVHVGEDVFRVTPRPLMTVMGLLLEIARNPVTVEGKRVNAPAFGGSCAEETCGACAMLINGWPALACATRVEKLESPVTLAPLGKFPVERDLVVSRERMHHARARTGTAIQLDSVDGPAPQSAWDAQEIQALSTCTQCGICLESCPNVFDGGGFVGPAVVHESRLLGLHPLGKMQEPARLAALSGPGGLADCSNAQVCDATCPVGLPLTSSLSRTGGQLTRLAWMRLVGRRD